MTLALGRETNKVITVVDDKTDPVSPVTLGTWTLGPTASTPSPTASDKSGVAGTCTDYTNIAMIEETEQSDTQKVTVCVGKDLTVSKTAAGTFDRTVQVADRQDRGRHDAVEHRRGRHGHLQLHRQGRRRTATPTAAGRWAARSRSTTRTTGKTSPSDVTDAVRQGGTCTVTEVGPDVLCPRADQSTLDYTCTFAPTGSYSGKNTATATWDAAVYFTPTGSASRRRGCDLHPARRDESTSSRWSTTRPTRCSPVTLGTATTDADRSSHTFTYSLDSRAWRGTCTDYTNTAVINETESVRQPERSRSASARTSRSRKTATAPTTGTYKWLIDKSVDDTRIEIAEGGTATFNYTVKVTPERLHRQRLDAGRHDHGHQPERLGGHHGRCDRPVRPGWYLHGHRGGDDVLVPKGGSVTLDYTCAFDATGLQRQEHGHRDLGQGCSTSRRAARHRVKRMSTLALAGETNRDDHGGGRQDRPAEPGHAGHERLLCRTVRSSPYALDKQGVAGTCTDYTNTAVIDETDQSDSQTVTVCVGKDLTVTKTAYPVLHPHLGLDDHQGLRRQLQPVRWATQSRMATRSP